MYIFFVLIQILYCLTIIYRPCLNKDLVVNNFHWVYLIFHMTVSLSRNKPSKTLQYRLLKCLPYMKLHFNPILHNYPVEYLRMLTWLLVWIASIFGCLYTYKTSFRYPPVAQNPKMEIEIWTRNCMVAMPPMLFQCC